MNWLNDLGLNLRQFILMQDKIDRLGDEVKNLRTDVRDHGYRLVHIETMIEMAQGNVGPSTPNIERP